MFFLARALCQIYYRLIEMCSLANRMIVFHIEIKKKNPCTSKHRSMTCRTFALKRFSEKNTIKKLYKYLAILISNNLRFFLKNLRLLTKCMLADNSPAYISFNLLPEKCACGSWYFKR